MLELSRSITILDTGNLTGRSPGPANPKRTNHKIRQVVRRPEHPVDAALYQPVLRREHGPRRILPNQDGVVHVVERPLGRDRNVASPNFFAWIIGVSSFFGLL